MSYLYHLSHFVIPVIGFLVTGMVGIIVSLVTDGCSMVDDIDPKLMSGITNKLRGLSAEQSKEIALEIRNGSVSIDTKLKDKNMNNNYDSIKV